MTGDNQDPVTPDSTAPKFGTDQGTSGSTGQFGKEDLEKVLNQNRHAQDHIKTLESETAAMRAELQRLQEELARSRSIDELLDAMRQQDHNEPGPTAPQLNQEELLKTLKNEVFRDLTLAQQREIEVKNWNQSVEMLRQRHGDGFASYVDKRAAELNIPVEKMEELAKTSPKAFIELVSPGASRSAAPTTGSYKSSPIDADAETEAMFIKINTLRFRNTPEGKEAKRTWDDPDFQRRYRLWILERSKAKGSIQ
jgi:hypothetical protein